MKQNEFAQALLAHAAVQTEMLRIVVTYYAGVAKHDFVVGLSGRLVEELEAVSPVAAEMYERISRDADPARKSA